MCTATVAAYKMQSLETQTLLPAGLQGRREAARFRPSHALCMCSSSRPRPLGPWGAALLTFTSLLGSLPGTPARTGLVGHGALVLHGCGLTGVQGKGQGCQWGCTGPESTGSLDGGLPALRFCTVSGGQGVPCGEACGAGASGLGPTRTPGVALTGPLSGINVTCCFRGLGPSLLLSR